MHPKEAALHVPKGAPRGTDPFCLANGTFREEAEIVAMLGSASGGYVAEAPVLREDGRWEIIPDTYLIIPWGHAAGFADLPPHWLRVCDAFIREVYRIRYPQLNPNNPCHNLMFNFGADAGATLRGHLHSWLLFRNVGGSEQGLPAYQMGGAMAVRMLNGM